jgi:Tfp pilus assembly protein PilO
MKIFGQELSKREQVMIFATLSVTVLTGFFFLLGGDADASESPSEIRTRLEGATGKLEADLRKMNSLQAKLNLEKVELPKTAESPSVHLYIEKTARESGLGFSVLTASNPKREGRYFQTVTFRFTVTSELKSLVKFVDTIQTGKYLIAIENWNMKPTDDPKNVETDLSLKAYFEPEKGS